MSCLDPQPCWRRSNGPGVTFSFSEAFVDLPMSVPCGKCVGCRKDRVSSWAMRILHEYQTSDSGAFITLTYSDDNLPSDGNLVLRDFQLFLKRLRKDNIGTKIKYFHCGEYGSKYGRPHYHAILFGIDFLDRVVFSQTPNGPLYTSPYLERVWRKGFVTLADVTPKSAAYVAGYVLKKFCTDLNEDGRVSEYHTVSRGLGRDWISKYSDEVLVHGYIVVDGYKKPIPRYYLEILKSVDSNRYDSIIEKRQEYARLKSSDSTPERLATKRAVKEAQESFRYRERRLRDVC